MTQANKQKFWNGTEFRTTKCILTEEQMNTLREVSKAAVFIWNDYLDFYADKAKDAHMGIPFYQQYTVSVIDNLSHHTSEIYKEYEILPEYTIKRIVLNADRALRHDRQLKYEFVKNGIDLQKEKELNSPIYLEYQKGLKAVKKSVKAYTQTVPIDISDFTISSNNHIDISMFGLTKTIADDDKGEKFWDYISNISKNPYANKLKISLANLLIAYNKDKDVYSMSFSIYLIKNHLYKDYGTSRNVVNF